LKKEEDTNTNYLFLIQLIFKDYLFPILMTETLITSHGKIKELEGEHTAEEVSEIIGLDIEARHPYAHPQETQMLERAFFSQSNIEDKL
jgi:hypothetical protein